jgi:hypothetical protein
MPPIPISEAQHGSAKYGSINRKDITDSNSGQKMSLQFLKVNFQDKSGKVVRPVFEGPEVTFPRGITKEDYKVKGLCVYDVSNEDVRQMIESTAHTQKRGWVKKVDVNLEIDIEEKTATSKDGELSVHESPDGDVSFTVAEDEALIVYGQKKAGSSVWLQVKTRGTKGHFQQIHDLVSEVIFEKKDDLKLSSKETVSEIQSMMKHPIYFPKNKETGEYDDSKNPSSFPMFLYYKDATQENFADIVMPGSKDKLMPSDLEGVSFSGYPVYDFSRYLVSADRINPQTKIVSFVITKIEKIERMSLQQETINRLGVDDTQLKKNLAILKEARKNAQQSPPSQSSTLPKREESSMPVEESGADEDDIDAILNGGSGSDDVEIQPESEFPEVPGLDD